MEGSDDRGNNLQASQTHAHSAAQAGGRQAAPLTGRPPGDAAKQSSLQRLLRGRWQQCRRRIPAAGRCSTAGVPCHPARGRSPAGARLAWGLCGTRGWGWPSLLFPSPLLDLAQQRATMRSSCRPRHRRRRQAQHCCLATPLLARLLPGLLPHSSSACLHLLLSLKQCAQQVLCSSSREGMGAGHRQCHVRVSARQRDRHGWQM